MSRSAANPYRNMSNGPNPSSSNPPPNSLLPGPGPSATSNPQPRAGTMSRAERFEDEKRRIIESCFSKLDPNGQLAESYITHIRIQEDAQHPSAPPPPDSAPDNKKPRLIIIAVRSTGRVRMHKARENTNGSFSIGKTWNMEELSAIESFAPASPPQTEKEAQYRSWAGSVGFVVTITKPYYWQAGTAKEKDFFIASTVKIYRKYTKGQLPELRGFDENQKAAMLGVMPGQPPPQPQQQPTPPQVSRGPGVNQSPVPPHPPFAQRPQSREDSRYRESPGPPPSMSDREFRNGSGANSRHPSESRERFPSSSSSVPRPFASTEHLRSNSREGVVSSSPRPGTSPGPGGYPRSPPPPASQMPPPPTTPSTKSSQSQLRSESPANPSVSSARERPPPFRPQSPPRKGSYQAYQHSMDRVQENGDRDMVPPPNGASGQALFASARQRMGMAQQPPPSPSQAPQLPPLETSQPFNVGGHQRQPTGEQVPQTTESEVSSAGIDAAAMAGLTGFLGPDHSQAVVPTPTVKEPSSPPIPDRPKNRPPIQESVSESTLDLRPPPLNRRSRPAEEESDFATASEGPTPMTEEPPEIKALSPTRTKSESNLPMPSTFQHSPSPLGSPPETPGEGKDDPLATPVSPEEPYRPGLGPMIKKQAVANKFKRAATAANAFKPRPGGAAEKILKLKEERDGFGARGLEPDGITAVVPRPSMKQEQTRDEPPPTPQIPPEDLSVKEPPKVEVSSPASPARAHSYQMPDGMDGARGVELQDEPARLQTPDQQERQEQLEEEEEQERVEQRQVRQPQVKVKRRSAQQQRYLEELGIDPSLLVDKSLDFEAMLYDFGWNDTSLSPKALSDMEAEIKREQSRLEAGSWLSGSPGASATPQENSIEERAKQVQTLLDKAIQECDELDGLLTLYNVELSSLNTDVAFIEAQSQGLQVQAANQRLLHNELKSLMDTMSLDKRVLEPLRRADLADAQGLEDAEQSLVRLYQAMITIDPNIRSNAAGRPKSRGGMGEDNQLSAMAAVRSKRDVYERESNGFCQRLMQHLDYMFMNSLNDAKGRVLIPAGGNASAMKLNVDVYADLRRGLWMYGPLILFAKELNQPAWQTILRMYYSRAKPVYSDAFTQNIVGWKRAARKPVGDDSEILFTAQEKEDASSGGGALTSTARKLTVKRSQTLAKTLRSASGGYNKDGAGTDSRSSGSLMYCQVFSGAMDEMAPLISQEQNFIVDLFHATSLETADFMDAVAATPPAERHGTNLVDQKPTEPNREIARRVTDVMLEIFGFYRTEMSTLMDWSMSNDPIQGVGVMACLSRHAYYLHEGSQEFLIQLVDGLVSHLQNRFAKFVEDQVKAVEDTKVKIKKRKGVISFMRTFPQFATAVENTFVAVGGVDYDNQADCMFDVRQRVDEAYARINKAMFDSLKVIAKEGPATASTTQTQKAGGVDDPEDKEILNYHVLMIENMNYFIEEVDDGGHQGVLAEWKGRALMERAEALEAYVGQVIRRPLGKLLEFLDSIDSIKESHPHNPGQITSRPSYSRKAARNMLSQYDSKEVRRGIDTLRRRIDKHFHDVDDEPHSKALISYVCKECERFCEKTITRIEDVIKELYPITEGEKNVEIEFSKTDVQAGFRR